MSEEALRLGFATGVVCQVLVVIALLVQAWGWRKGLLTAAGIILLCWMIEWMGSAASLPFGNYSYTPVLQPQILGVPVLIPLAWLMMFPPSWAVAAVLLGSPHKQKSPRARLAFILLSAIVFTAWDFFLEHQMVALDIWFWEQPTGYFGIPWSNFLGWLFVSAAITALFGGANLPYLPLVLVYAITWALQAIAQFLFWGFSGPDIFGFLAMGAVTAIAVYKALQLSKKTPRDRIPGCFEMLVLISFWS